MGAQIIDWPVAANICHDVPEQVIVLEGDSVKVSYYRYKAVEEVHYMAVEDNESHIV